MRLTRSLATILLASQFAWLAAPILCQAPVNPSCPETTLPAGHGHAVPGIPVDPVCTMPAACGVPVVVPATVVFRFSTPLDRVATVERPPLVSAEPTAPLPPPPQV